MSKDLEKRIEALEAAAEKAQGEKGEKGDKGDTGARGPAGPIDAALAGANKAVQDAEESLRRGLAETVKNEVAGRVESAQSELSNELAAKVKEVIEKILPTFINSAVSNQLVETLKEYKLLDEQGQPSLKYVQHEIDAAVAKALAAKEKS